jgi:hypothetical protein
MQIRCSTPINQNPVKNNQNQSFGMAFKPTKNSIPEKLLKDRDTTKTVHDLFKGIKKIAERAFGPKKLVNVTPKVNESGELSAEISLSEKAIDQIKSAKNKLDEVFEPDSFKTDMSNNRWSLHNDDSTADFLQNLKKSVAGTVRTIKDEIVESRQHDKRVKEIFNWTGEK